MLSKNKVDIVKCMIKPTRHIIICKCINILKWHKGIISLKNYMRHARYIENTLFN